MSANPTPQSKGVTADTIIDVCRFHLTAHGELRFPNDLRTRHKDKQHDTDSCESLNGSDLDTFSVHPRLNCLKIPF